MTLCSTALYGAGVLLLHFPLQYLKFHSDCLLYTDNTAECSHCSFVDKPHNPMVNAGAIVCTSLIKVRATHYFYYLLSGLCVISSKGLECAVLWPYC